MVFCIVNCNVIVLYSTFQKILFFCKLFFIAPGQNRIKKEFSRWKKEEFSDLIQNSFFLLSAKNEKRKMKKKKRKRVLESKKRRIKTLFLFEISSKHRDFDISPRKIMKKGGEKTLFFCSQPKMKKTLFFAPRRKRKTKNEKEFEKNYFFLFFLFAISGPFWIIKKPEKKNLLKRAVFTVISSTCLVDSLPSDVWWPADTTEPGAVQ